MAIVRLRTVSEEKPTQYNMVQHKYLCGVSEGRDLVYKDMECVCAEGVVFGRFIYCIFHL